MSGKRIESFLVISKHTHTHTNDYGELHHYEMPGEESQGNVVAIVSL